MPAINAPVVPVAGPQPAPLLLGKQTAGSLLRHIVHMYRQYPSVVFVCSVLPALPPTILLQWTLLHPGPLMWVALALFYVATFLASGMMTVAISDICVGNRPDGLHALKRVTSGYRWWYIVWSGLLLGLGVGVGVLLLVLPGLWLMGRGFLVSIVATLEGRSGLAAIRRSFELTRGQAWRVLGLTLLPALMAYGALIIVMIALSIPLALLIADEVTVALLINFVSSALSLVLLTPVITMTMVLLYYDQRVRREAYDVQTLAEDLMR